MASKASMILNLGFLLSLVLLVTTAEGKQDSNGKDCKNYYGVQSGDTCYAVWEKFNLTKEEFYNINPDIVCDKMLVGQHLCVDGKAPGLVNPPAPAPSSPGSENTECKTYYEVHNGDTCYAISKNFNLTQEELSAANPNVVCDELFLGQKLCVEGRAPGPLYPPAPAPQKPSAPGSKNPKCKTFYEVQNGDTCYAIMKKFNLAQKKFNAINPHIVCDKLFISQQLCIDGQE